MNARLDTVVDPATATSDWLRQQKGRVDAALSVHLNDVKRAEPQQSRLLDAVEYSLTQGGKRLRPILTLESAAACGIDDDRAMPAAIAIECVHAFSLIHDDLPAMDDDDLRRGVPTNHKVFGEALAILAGDWLLAHALELLARHYPAPAAVELTTVLCGGTKAMIAGQAADIAGEGQPVRAELVRYIHQHKTARLIQAGCRLGAIAAGANEKAAAGLGDFGLHLGLAFQIVDDILDCTATTEQLGKRAAKDAVAAKQTYPGAFGLDESRRRAESEVEAAINALKAAVAGPERLIDLARFVLAREH